MFLTIKRSNISDCLTPLIMPSGCPCRGTALPCPDGCRKAMSEAPKSHFLKGGLSACKRYPFGLQKTTFCEPKDDLLESPEKQPFATAAVCRRRMRPRFRQKYLTAKKQKQHKPRSVCPQQQNATQRTKKAEARTKKPHGENMRRKGRKTPQAEKPCGSTAGKQGISNAMPHTYNIYSAQRAENSEQEIILV